MSHTMTVDERTAMPPGQGGATVHVPAEQAAPRGRVKRFFLGMETDPVWARPALWGLLLVAAVVYFVNLTNSGYANDFYAAAVKSSTKSWTAWLFGSLDSANSITVDKPPAAMWVMGLSARIFGFSSFSMLMPEALMGVGTVALVAASVRRWYGHAAGLIAGAVVVLTPVAAMMFRFNNPDALLTILMAAAAYFVTRAIETQRGRRALWWMVGAGAAIGFAFLTKMLQGMLVLPGFVIAYLVAAPRSWKARIGHLFAALGSLIVSAGWFVLLVELWPASSRPYIGGSTNNSEWELAIGYNGLGRIFGGSGNAGGMGGGGGGFGGTAGILRMFNSQFGTEVSWLLPAALILLVAGLVARGRAPRTDLRRAGLLVWGGWMLSTAAVLSLMSGTVHSYYSVALVPGIAATIGIGMVEALRAAGRSTNIVKAIAWRTAVALSLSVSAGWGFWLMSTYAASWHPRIRWAALIGGIGGAIAWLLLASFARTNTAKSIAIGALIVASLSAVAPTASWTAATIAVGHTGSMPTAGPASASTGGMGGGGQQGGTPPTGTSGQTGTAPTGTSGTSNSGTSTSGQAPTGTAPTGTSGTAPTGTSGTSGTQSGTAPSGTAPTGTSGPSGSSSTSTESGSSSSSSTTQRGGMGGGMDGSSNSELIAALNKTTTKWSAAVIGDQSAAGLILNSNTAVMSIGGWGGSDNNVTLAQFKQYVASGQITYFIASGQMGGGPGGGSSSASAITQWVEANFKSTTIGGTTVYILTSAK